LASRQCSRDRRAAAPTQLRASQGFDDKYIRDARRGSDGCPSGIEGPLFPVAIVLDAALLPFEVIAGYIH
jgi:hypothetical protein